MKNTIPLFAALVCLVGLSACATLEVKPIEVKPIHVTVDVNVHVQKDLEDFFAFEKEGSATQPTTQEATWNKERQGDTATRRQGDSVAGAPTGNPTPLLLSRYAGREPGEGSTLELAEQSATRTAYEQAPLSLSPSLLVSLPSSAATDSESQLKERFKSRLPALTQLKSQGKVGVTFEGYVAAVKDQSLPAAAQTLIADENTDRRELYQIIAKRDGSSVEVVGQNNFLREYNKAPGSYWFKAKDGQWKQKG